MTKSPSDPTSKYSLAHCDRLLVECPDGLNRLFDISQGYKVRKNIEPRGGDKNKAKAYVKAMAKGAGK